MIITKGSYSLIVCTSKKYKKKKKQNNKPAGKDSYWKLTFNSTKSHSFELTFLLLL